MWVSKQKMKKNISNYSMMNHKLSYIYTLVLFILLPISQTNDSTLGESIFGLLENLLERKEKLNKKVIGSGIMGVVQN